MIDVHMADGRTVFRFKSRGSFIDLLSRDLSGLDSSRATSCWVRWSPQEEFTSCRIMSVRKHSVSFTREITGEERQEFDTKFPPSVNEQRIRSIVVEERACPTHNIVLGEGPCPICSTIESSK